MIQKSDVLAKLSGFWFFHRWHPEVALRYLPIVKEVNKLGKKATILEVGSGGLGIAPYLKRNVTGVDIDFQPPYHDLLKKIKASATSLPFANSSFDIVLSVDTLEHLEQKERKKAIDEMIRVARRKLIIAFPCGKDAQEEDLLLTEFSKKHAGKIIPFLKEHLGNKLPEKEEVIGMIKIASQKYDKRVSIIEKGNENMLLHRFLLKGYMFENLLIDFFFRKILLLAIPMMRLINCEPTYRKIFIIVIAL